MLETTNFKKMLKTKYKKLQPIKIECGKDNENVQMLKFTIEYEHSNECLTFVHP